MSFKPGAAYAVGKSGVSFNRRITVIGHSQKLEKTVTDESGTLSCGAERG